MVDLTLYFAPFPGSNAIGLQIEESPDGLGSWVQLADTAEIGEYPNWVSSYVVQATSIDFWFRIRWQLEQTDPNGPDLFTEWSAPVLGSALPFHWTVPDLYRLVTQHKVSGWSNIQLQMVIDRAYFLIQNECGPYDETDPAFPDIAQLVIHSVMDQMLPALTRAGLGRSSGMEEEQMGSYRYKRRLEGVMDVVAGAFVLPVDLLDLICPFGQREDLLAVSTTHVFLETEHTLAGTGRREKVFTDADRTTLAPGGWPFPWWPKQGRI